MDESLSANFSGFKDNFFFRFLTSYITLFFISILIIFFSLFYGSEGKPTNFHFVPRFQYLDKLEGPVEFAWHGNLYAPGLYWTRVNDKGRIKWTKYVYPFQNDTILSKSRYIEYNNNLFWTYHTSKGIDIFMNERHVSHMNIQSDFMNWYVMNEHLYLLIGNDTTIHFYGQENDFQGLEMSLTIQSDRKGKGIDTFDEWLVVWSTNRVDLFLHGEFYQTIEENNVEYCIMRKKTLFIVLKSSSSYSIQMYRYRNKIWSYVSVFHLDMELKSLTIGPYARSKMAAITCYRQGRFFTKFYNLFEKDDTLTFHKNQEIDLGTLQNSYKTEESLCTTLMEYNNNLYFCTSEYDSKKESHLYVWKGAK